jgi:hypothetical protein
MMRFFLIAIALCAVSLFVSLFVSGPANAQSREDISWCRTAKAPQLIIKPVTDKVTYNHTKTKSQLNNFEVDTVNPYGTKVHTDVGGIMRGGIETNYATKFAGLRSPEGQSCVWFDTVTVDIKITPTIFIAKDYKKGSCMYNAVLEHETKHVNVDRSLVNTYAQTIGAALQKELSGKTVYGPVPSARESATQDQMQRRISKIMKDQMAVLNAERLKRQQQVDSLAEYNRVNAMCPGQR